MELLYTYKEGKTIEMKKTRTKCKCECHIPQDHGRSDKKKVKASICSYCMENHKRSKHYKGLKAFSQALEKFIK